MTPEQMPPPGWFPAVHAGGELRYWDGTTWLDVAPPPAASIQLPAATYATAPVPPPKRRRGWLFPVTITLAIICLGGIIIATIYWAVQSAADAQALSENSLYGGQADEAVAEPEPQLPAGYTDLGGGLGLGGKWVDEPCALSTGGCDHMEVYALNGCPTSLYVEMNLLDSSGRVIGMTNDVAGRLGAGQTALLEFAYFDENAARIELSDASCF